MKIQYIGKSAIREIDDERGRFVWAGDVDYSQDVPASLAAELLTYPRHEFVPDIADPLCALPGLRVTVNGEPVPFGVGGMDALLAAQREAESKLAALALAGCGSAEKLAKYSAKDLEMLSAVTSIDLETIRGWQKQLKGGE